MRLLYLLLLSRVFINVAKGQTDTTYYPDGNGMQGLMKAQRSFIFIDITNNTWVNRPGEIETDIVSGGFNLNLSYDFALIKNIVSIAPGISFSNSTVKNNSYYSYISIGTDKRAYTQLTPYPDSAEYLKNKYSTDYFDIPIEIRFRIKPEQRGKNFWIAPGFRAGILISDFWKLKYENDDGYIVKSKVYGISNVENFHYGVSLRAGYYKFGFYTFLALNNLFVDDKGPELVQYSFGLTFTPF